MTRKYNTMLRKKLKEKINSVKDLNDTKYIYNLIKNNCTINKSGCYFDVNKLDDGTIENILNHFPLFNLA
jgi:hypothetical protein